MKLKQDSGIPYMLKAAPKICLLMDCLTEITIDSDIYVYVLVIINLNSFLLYITHSNLHKTHKYFRGDPIETNWKTYFCTKCKVAPGRVYQKKTADKTMVVTKATKAGSTVPVKMLDSMVGELLQHFTICLDLLVSRHVYLINSIYIND